MNSKKSNSRKLVNMAFFGMPLLALVIVFLLSQRIGGRAWDEDFDYRGVAGQLDVAYRYITGDAGANFTQVPNDFAYYGIVAVLPAYVAERVATYYGFPDALAVYVFALHAVAFSCSVFTVLTTFFILLRATGSRTAAGIGAGLLAIYPLWFGFSFFDHKDVPTAFFFTLALYGGVGLLQAADEDRTRRFFTLVLAMATILIAGLKIIALILVVPSWVAAFYVYLRGRDFNYSCDTCRLVGALQLCRESHQCHVTACMEWVHLECRNQYVHPWRGLDCGAVHSDLVYCAGPFVDRARRCACRLDCALAWTRAGADCCFARHSNSSDLASELDAL